MAEKKKYNSILISGRKDETLTYSKFVKDEESGESVKESLDKKVNVTDELTTQQIKDGAITNKKMAADSVGNTNLQDGSVSNEKLEDGSITNEKLAENSITKDKLKDNTIGVEKLDPELRQTINAATGLPENLVETIQNVDDTLKDHQSQLDNKQSQIDDKQQQITANDEDISLLKTRSTQMEETIKSIAATGGASQAIAVTYNNEKSSLVAINAQAAIDEVDSKVSNLSDEINTITTGKTTETNVISETIISKATFGSKEFVVEKDTVYNIYLQSDGSLQQSDLSVYFAEQNDNILSEIANYGSNGFKEEVHVTVKCTNSSSNARLRLSYTAGVDNVSLNFRVTKVNITDSVYEKIDKTKDELDNKINSANECIKHNNNKMCLGIANTSTIPESPRNQNEFYFAFQEGEYSNFKNWDNGNVFIDGKSLHIIRPFYQNDIWAQTWCAESIGINTTKYSSKILGIANPTSMPLVPTFENNFGYIAVDAGTYNNFLEEDGNPIELDGEYVVYIRPAFQKGVFAFWYEERLFSIKHNYIPKCAGYADTDTMPDIPSKLYDFYYIAFKKGEYLNFKDYKGKNIVLDGNYIYLKSATYRV